MRLDRRDLAALAAALLVAGACVRLGVWQLGRLKARRESNVRVAAARARPVLDLSGPRLPLDSLRDRHLRARGVYDYGREQLWHGRSYEGIPGVDVITPLRLPTGVAVLVDRGWAPSPDGYHIDLRAYRESDSGLVDGLGAAPPRGRGDIDLARLADSFPYPVLPVVLEASPSPPSTAPATRASPPPEARLRRWPPAPLTEGPHLSYVIQWFSFALITLVGSLVLVRKRGEGGLRARIPTEGYQ